MEETGLRRRLTRLGERSMGMAVLTGIEIGPLRLTLVTSPVGPLRLPRVTSPGIRGPIGWPEVLVSRVMPLGKVIPVVPSVPM